MKNGELVHIIDALTEEAKRLLFIKIKSAIGDGTIKSNEKQNKHIVAYIKGKSAFNLDNFKLELKKQLPDYMVPTSFVQLEKMPLLPNGKIDRSQLSNLKKQPIVVNPKSINTNNTVNQLIKIWEDVLNIKPIHATDNFFEVGGDSILSIQVIAKARKKGIEITPNQLFENQTISRLLQDVHLINSPTQQTHPLLAKPVSLTPIQHWFFDTHKNAPEFWNQGIVLSNMPNMSKTDIKEITSILIKQHDSLRLSFRKENNSWVGHLLSLEEIMPYEFVNLYHLNKEEAEEIIKTHINDFQTNLSLSKGNLFKCFYFRSENDNHSKCILIAHHLVVDAVSWNIISDDFTDLIENFNKGIKDKYYSKTTTIDKWTAYLSELSTSEELLSEVSFWKEQTMSKSSLPLIKSLDLPLFEKDIKTITRILEEDDTQNLLLSSNKAYNTKIEDLLITALSITIGNWSKKEYLNLGLERHGRETINTDFDLSRTVNWHTSYFPIRLKFELDKIEFNIKSIKEQLRAIPNKGLGYGVLKYLNIEVSVDDLDNYSPDVVFNYLGVQNALNTEGVSKHTLEHIKLRDDYSERSYLFEINTFIKNNRLTINWSYSDKIYDDYVLNKLMTDFENNLKTIIEHCFAKESSYTPSDFPDALLNQDDLDNLLNSLD